jgi:chromatin remodeling complex protein RSC6
MSATLSVATPSATPAPLPTVVDVPAGTSTTEPSLTEEKVKKPRRVVSTESVASSFDALQKLVEEHINTLRKTATEATAKTGNTGIKFLRTVNSRIKQLKKDAVKVMEAAKKRPRRQAKTDGGFLKPHHVTKEIADFAGWPADSLKSRVDITNAICKYVKDNNLQDPTQRKHILPNETLRQLLQYDPSVSGNDALTYFYLQKLIGRFQVKDSAVAK